MERETRRGGRAEGEGLHPHSSPVPRADESRPAEAERFLTLLDEEAETFCFQTFDDSGKRGDLARTLHGTLAELWPRLEALNTDGAGVFVAVNEIETGKPRRTENVRRVRAVFADFDPPKTSGPPERYPLEPVILVESSPGKVHAYWTADGLELEAFNPVQRAIVAKLGSDPAPVDLPRVMRLPGFFHRKDPRRPFLVRLLAVDERLPYRPDDIERAFPPVEGQSGTGAKPAPPADPIAIALDTRGLLLRAKPGGGLFITCPWEGEHTTPSTPTATVYYPPHTGGYAGAAFKCQHGHCRHRTPADLRRWLGLDPPGGDEWPELQPLIASTAPEPYPLDALPAKIRAAVEEVQAFVKAPPCMVASSALAALSVAASHHVDIARAERLKGPSSLFLLTVADSGERKSTCDEYFSSPIREYQAAQAERMKPELARYAAEIAAWGAEREGILNAIRQAGKTGKAAHDKREALADLEASKPDPVRVPALLRGDDTPENLAWVLAREWPAAGILSSEAGVIFGAHGMGKDSIMRNLALLNILWDGGELSIGRRTKESFTVRGARLTMALQIQESTLRSFFDRSGGLARGTGFLARFLAAWPESTQGFRPFSEPPAQWPALAAYHRRLTEILETDLPMDDSGVLSPRLLPFSPKAKSAWITFHDAIEAELRPRGELFDVRDVASKIADNAARMAAQFHVFEHGPGGAVMFEPLEAAARIVAWHLNESRRFFGELALPTEINHATRLDAWLLDYCRRERTDTVPRREVQRHITPAALREGAALSAALVELLDLGRAREVSHGRQKLIQVRPELLAEVDP